LFLSHRLPSPPHNGAAIRTLNTLKVLSESYRITALCFDRLDPVLARMNVDERIAAIRPYATVEVFPIPQQHSRMRFVLDHTRSVLKNRAYTLFAYDSPEFSTAIRRVRASQTFAIAHVDSLDLARYIGQLGDLPVACTHHNVESQLLRRRAQNEPLLRRRYLELQADKLERLERYWLPRVAVNIAVSEDDAVALRRLAPTARVEVAPNGVDIDYFSPGSASQNGGRGCVFVGGTNWFPNREGLEWYHAEVLPRLRSIGEHPPTVWVGRCTQNDRERFGGPQGVEFTDYVADVRPYLRDAGCFIAPLRTGGGTRLKILDAWASGKAVVSTAQGCEGLAAVDGVNIMIADDPLAFAQAIQRILRDPALAARLGQAARDTAERQYSWNHIGQHLSRIYAEVRIPPGARQTSATRSA
jgi:glycosyltransferase involved in cell wall biosynthesis